MCIVHLGCVEHVEKYRCNTDVYCIVHSGCVEHVEKYRCNTDVYCTLGIVHMYYMCRACGEIQV